MAQVTSTELKLSRSCTCSSYLYHHGIQTIRVYNVYYLIPRMAMDQNPGKFSSPKTFVTKCSIPRSCLHQHVCVYVYTQYSSPFHVHNGFIYFLRIANIISIPYHVLYPPHHVYTYTYIYIYARGLRFSDTLSCV